MPDSRTRNSDSLHKRDPFTRSPIAQDGKTDRFRAIVPNEVRMSAISECASVLSLFPPTDKLFEASCSLSRHDEGDRSLIGTDHI